MSSEQKTADLFTADWKNEPQPQRWQSLTQLLNRPSDFAPPAFDAGDGEALQDLRENFRVLIVGAGGLGCEILKNLALSGITDIHIIDMDTIELSNLNRQFLFRKPDVGKSKAECAAAFVMKRVPGVTVASHNCPIQDKPKSFYEQFDCVVAGLDNVEARRWLNATLHELVKFDDEGNPDPESIIPFIDGGTEGFAGQVRLFVPRMSSCFECSIGTMTAQRGFAMCTIAATPRRPEHCIAFAHKILWPRLVKFNTCDDYELGPEGMPKDDQGQVKFDSDNVQHMSWMFRRAEERAKEFDISGVTYKFTMQVVKNIIPAIASTNALVSAACTNECFKALTWVSYGLNNYFQYSGNAEKGVDGTTFNYEKRPDCIVCGSAQLTFELDPSTTLSTFREVLKTDKRTQFKDPAVSSGDGAKVFYITGALKHMYKDNLAKPIGELFKDGEPLAVSDRVVAGAAPKITVKFVEGAFYEAPE